ncbi:MAG: dynamin family protein [Deltaproteobacteria bacterium]|nr:dynamin family protein [Deltaproteobacteria bacterium]
MSTTINDLGVEERLAEAGRILQTLGNEIAPFFGGDSAPPASWQRSLSAVAASLQERTLRIAVVGSVKSGKSTFINALYGRDFLKRGAGVVTAFITRVRSGAEEMAWVKLKSWAEINSEIQEAVTLAGLSQELPGLSSVDFRKVEDRRLLEQYVQGLASKQPLAQEGFDPNVVLLKAYIEGFSKVATHIGDGPSRLEFHGAELESHRSFVSEESLAVYLRDMEVQLPSSWLAKGIEIGDCQGSDSPNPFHFAKLQEYLLRCQCILYVISSRVGIRRADLKLIEAIQILRLLPQTLFILNADLDEHDTAEDLYRVQRRLAAELRLVVPEAKIYTFSALLQLFDSMEESLSPREQRRLEGWRQEKDLAQLSATGYQQFCTDLQNMLRRERHRLLYAGVLGHLERVEQSMTDCVATRQGLLSNDLQDLHTLAAEIRKAQDSVTAVLATVEHTLEGLRKSLKDRLGSAVDSYFDSKYGPIITETMDLIENHPVEQFCSSGMGERRKLLTSLYSFYQDFRKTLSRHIIDRVNLRVIDFVKNEEELVEKKILDSTEAYWELLAQALQLYRQRLVDLGLALREASPRNFPLIPKPALVPPPFSAFLQRADSLGRSSLLVRFGLGRLRQFFGGLKDRILRKNSAQASERLFREAVALVKKETQKELLACFRDYRQNLKFIHLFSFLDAYTDAVLQAFHDMSEAALLDIGQLQETAEKKGDDHQEASEDLTIVRQRLRYVNDLLHSLRTSIEYAVENGSGLA